MDLPQWEVRVVVVVPVLVLVLVLAVIGEEIVVGIIFEFIFVIALVRAESAVVFEFGAVLVRAEGADAFCLHATGIRAMSREGEQREGGKKGGLQEGQRRDSGGSA